MSERRLKERKMDQLYAHQILDLLTHLWRLFATSSTVRSWRCHFVLLIEVVKLKCRLFGRLIAVSKNESESNLKS